MAKTGCPQRLIMPLCVRTFYNWEYRPDPTKKNQQQINRYFEKKTKKILHKKCLSCHRPKGMELSSEFLNSSEIFSHTKHENNREFAGSTFIKSASDRSLHPDFVKSMQSCSKYEPFTQKFRESQSKKIIQPPLNYVLGKSDSQIDLSKRDITPINLEALRKSAAHHQFRMMNKKLWTTSRSFIVSTKSSGKEVSQEYKPPNPEKMPLHEPYLDPRTDFRLSKKEVYSRYSKSQKKRISNNRKFYESEKIPRKQLSFMKMTSENHKTNKSSILKKGIKDSNSMLNPKASVTSGVMMESGDTSKGFESSRDSLTDNKNYPKNNNMDRKISNLEIFKKLKSSQISESTFSTKKTGIFAIKVKRVQDSAPSEKDTLKESSNKLENEINHSPPLLFSPLKRKMLNGTSKLHKISTFNEANMSRKKKIDSSPTKKIAMAKILSGEDQAPNLLMNHHSKSSKPSPRSPSKKLSNNFSMSKIDSSIYSTSSKNLKKYDQIGRSPNEGIIRKEYKNFCETESPQEKYLIKRRLSPFISECVKNYFEAERNEL
ncbi:unnamed protein product [Moneuplotes crassus]|uniref:Uncharacterized protein n=1 Tax=Euplotes crassus TaxID=5936 RepID=A0AAD1X2B5_EUPCR|nr:unnamed protein product [Moneuplotes crassus]